MALLTIDGVALPSPDSYKVKSSDADSEGTGRDDGYVLQRDRIREGVYRIDATWTVSGTEYMMVASALRAKSFTAIFWDPNTASYITRTMYAGDRDGTLIGNLNSDQPEESLWELSCPLVEY